MEEEEGRREEERRRRGARRRAKGKKEGRNRSRERERQEGFFLSLFFPQEDQALRIHAINAYFGDLLRTFQKGAKCAAFVHFEHSSIVTT